MMKATAYRSPTVTKLVEIPCRCHVDVSVYQTTRTGP
ncbi:unnamed protein product [Haemonchus placei]|uniref:Coenzyme PQQ synthesis protein A n=1 Tax=Haemonchus placei TaxID=6290 RepID=A0A0N4X0B4_HAEPC|nr:unnamed protein product [Haemonchus placei]